jgi:multicomponent Na+:H+ antiporter subunit E
MGIGCVLSGEEYRPSEFAHHARRVEQARFEGPWICDHFHPCNDEQRESLFVWSVTCRVHANFLDVMAVRAAALAVWAYAVWLLLTWTATAEQLITGALIAVLVGCALAPLGPVVAPWTALAPRRMIATLVLLADSTVRIVRANLSLARRIWAPGRPLRSGMIILPTEARTDGEIAATALITTMIVDNQIVDLDRSAAEFQYHAVDVPGGDPAERRERVNGPTERHVLRIAGTR